MNFFINHFTFFYLKRKLKPIKQLVNYSDSDYDNFIERQINKYLTLVDFYSHDITPGRDSVISIEEGYISIHQVPTLTKNKDRLEYAKAKAIQTILDQYIN